MPKQTGGPTPADLFRMYRAVRRGSAADERMSLRELVSDLRHRSTAPDSPMSMKDAVGSPELGDLSTARVAVGDNAPAIEGSVLDARDGGLRDTGRVFRLAEHRDVRPVALIFGSYT